MDSEGHLRYVDSESQFHSEGKPPRVSALLVALAVFDFDEAVLFCGGCRARVLRRLAGDPVGHFGRHRDEPAGRGAEDREQFARLGRNRLRANM